MPGLRPARVDQMHLTLHFLGEAYVPRTTDALRRVSCSGLELTLRGVGQFPSAGGSVTLWSGVRQDEELLQLYDQVATALGAIGFQKEARPYTPHITLARIDAGVSSTVVEDFLSKHASFERRQVVVPGISLFSSSWVDGVPAYRRESSVTFPAPP